MNKQFDSIIKRLRAYEERLSEVLKREFRGSNSHLGFAMLNLLVGLLGVVSIYNLPPSNALSLMASTTYTVVSILACSFLVLRPILLFMTNQGQPLLSVVMQIGVTVVILSFIDTQGDMVIGSALDHPQITIGIIVGYFIANLIYKLSTPFSIGHTRVEVGRMAVSMKKQPSERDLDIAAVHEAGHALMYAAVRNVPDSLTVKLLDGFDRAGVLGTVSCEVVRHTLMKKSELEFYMYLSLAGVAAEKVRFGEVFSGASNDLAQWGAHCETYLLNGFGERLYLPNAATDLDREANAKMRNTLHADQLLALSNFFGRNWKVLSELAGEIRESKTLQSEQLKPYLDRVDVPEWLPDIDLNDAKKADTLPLQSAN